MFILRLRETEVFGEIYGSTSPKNLWQNWQSKRAQNYQFYRCIFWALLVGQPWSSRIFLPCLAKLKKELFFLGRAANRPLDGPIHIVELLRKKLVTNKFISNVN